ncbi:MAG: DUF3040 domain-containing protein [Acidimicrobiia bacterium]
MPLSDDELKILAQIEEGIKKTDPNLAQQVEQSSVYKYSGKKIALSIFVSVVLLATILFTFSSKLWPIAFIAFIIMVFVGISFVDHIVKITRASAQDAKKQAQKINTSSTWRSRRDY